MGETSLEFESPLGRTSPFSLARSGVDSSDVLLEARRDLVERVEAGLGLGVRVDPYSAILVLPPDDDHGKGKIDSGDAMMMWTKRTRLVETSGSQPRSHRTIRSRCLLSILYLQASRLLHHSKLEWPADRRKSIQR